ncbi:MAG: hypothetical protein ACRDI0_11465 [Actinomycetota bacterium]
MASTHSASGVGEGSGEGSAVGDGAGAAGDRSAWGEGPPQDDTAKTPMRSRAGIFVVASLGEHTGTIQAVVAVE